MHKEGVPRRFLAATRRALIAPPRYNSHERDCATDWLCARPQVYIHAHDHITQDVPRSRMSCARQGQRTASVAQHAVYRNDQPQRVQRGRKEERDGSQRHLVPDNGRLRTGARNGTSIITLRVDRAKVCYPVVLHNVAVNGRPTGLL